jgi:TolB-like protein/tRNA A-37 threonylcarbamoyl transferase component Bud32
MPVREPWREGTEDVMFAVRSSPPRPRRPLVKGSSGTVSGLFADRYTIEHELGRGATSVVYLARELSSGRAVAIKILRAELVTEISTERFLREIRVTTRLQHPSIVPVLDSGEYDDRLFFVLPHMDGGTLRARLEREKQLPIGDVIEIGKTIAAALQFAHERKLLHRDVKPENILFGDGKACLADFGIARALSEASGESGMSSTSTGVVRGTPAYMSPEQAAGDHNIDARSDIYSLACVLYEMVAGVPAFVGPTAQSIVSQRLVHMPRPLRVFRPAVPPEMEAVIERALATAPADRYQTAYEFFAALESVEPYLARPSGATRFGDSPALSPSWLRRPSRPLAIVGGIAVVSVALALASIRRPAPTADIPEGDPRRIAVMYFDDLTPDAVPTHVADGITEDLIDQLGAVSALRVMSPDAVRAFRKSPVVVDSVARSLKVGTIISGSLARSGTTIRINVRLVDANTGHQLYSRSLEEEWTELFTLQDKLTEEVAFFLRQRLGDVIALRQHRAATKSYAAWETLQLGSDATRRAIEAGIVSNDSTVPRLFLVADSLFARAEALDPSWVYPTIRRGRIALSLAFRSPVPPRRGDSVAYAKLSPANQHVVWIRRAIQLAGDALRRDASSPEALELRGEANFAFMNAGASANDSLAASIERDLRAALLVRPNSALAWSTLAQLARARGQFADAAAAAKRGFEADAFFEVRRVVSIGFMASLHAGEFEDARRWCRIGLVHYSGDPRFTECQLTILGWTAASRDEAASAWRLVDDIERRDTLHILATTWGYRRLMVAAILARSGATDSARRVLDRVRATTPTDPSKRNTLSTEAYVQVLLGERDAALANLAAYLRVTPLARAQTARNPWFRGLHNDPRFIALVQQTP